MKIAALIYATYLACLGVDPNKIPDRCFSMEFNHKVITDAKWLTGYDDPTYKESYPIVKAKYNILECLEKKNEDNPKYLDRIKIWRKSGDSTTLDFWVLEDCPEILKYIEKAWDHPQTNLTAIEKVLRKNLQDQSDRYQCDKLHQTHSHHRHHKFYKKNLREGK